MFSWQSSAHPGALRGESGAGSSRYFGFSTRSRAQGLGIPTPFNDLEKFASINVRMDDGTFSRFVYFAFGGYQDCLAAAILRYIMKSLRDKYNRNRYRYRFPTPKPIIWDGKPSDYATTLPFENACLHFIGVHRISSVVTNHFPVGRTAARVGKPALRWIFEPIC